MICIIDYGMGNLGSIKNMLRKIGSNSIITSDHNEIKKADKLILPGVGSFDNAVNNLKKLKIIDLLNKLVLKNKIPILGICLGMQILSNKSEEGKLDGLSWINAETVRFNFSDKKYKTPHMGWNEVKIKKKDKLFKNMYKDPKFYFVHSYYLKCSDKNNILTTTDYGIDFCSSINKNNIYGVQFHPEKSHKYGMCLLKNFVELC